MKASLPRFLSRSEAAVKTSGEERGPTEQPDIPARAEVIRRLIEARLSFHLTREKTRRKSKQ
jgi:hypothetical protein